MKLLFVLCLGLIALRQADAFWHHKFDYLWDWDDNAPSDSDCLVHVRYIALLISKGVSINEISNLDPESLRCISYYNLLGYFLNDKNKDPNSAAGTNGNNPGNIVPPVNIPPQLMPGGGNMVPPVNIPPQLIPGGGIGP